MCDSASAIGIVPPARITRADEDPELELIVQAIARPYHGLQGAGGSRCPCGLGKVWPETPMDEVRPW